MSNYPDKCPFCGDVKRYTDSTSWKCGTMMGEPLAQSMLCTIAMLKQEKAVLMKATGINQATIDMMRAAK